jgi:hypothetical protein
MNSTNSAPSSPSAQVASSSTPQSIRLTIQGLGEVVSFKNSKVIASGKLFTKPRYAEWMKNCTDSFALQLLCEYRTRENATPTGLSRPSWIALSVPLDDSVREIVEERIVVQFVEKGQEGAEIVIENL